MKVLTERQEVVLRLRDPARVLDEIPTAKQMTIKDKEFVIVPHRYTETMALRKLGYKAPLPIEYYYEWPGRFSPFKAQKEAATFLTRYRRAFNLSEIGTGKSLASLWAYDYLRSVGKAKKALVVAPLSTLDRTWADEIFQHFMHLTFEVLYGSRDKRIKLLAKDADIYIINIDGLNTIKGELARRRDIDLVIVDEISQVARNKQTRRWETLDEVVNMQCGGRSCWGMTGTPIPNAPTDAWAQCKLLVPHRVPKFFGRFRSQTMLQGANNRWFPKKGAVDEVRAVMRPAIRFTRDECLDLPPIMYETRNIPLTKAQQDAYRKMLNDACVYLAEGDVNAVNAMARVVKLMQIACGVVYTNDGEEAVIPPTNRLREIEDIIDQSEGKVIVYVPFRNSVRMVAKELGKNHRVGTIYSDVSLTKRNEIFSEFQDGNSGMDVLVAVPSAMSHGLTLTKASTIVWYSAITSNDVFVQANGRITRSGQKNNMFVIMLEGTVLERDVYNRVKDKQAIQNALLDAVKQYQTENKI